MNTIETQPPSEALTESESLECLSKPDRFAPYHRQIIPLRKARQNIDKEIAENRRKLADAITERNELENSGPPNGDNDRKLAEAIIRVQLFTNHQAKLEARLAEVIQQAALTTGGFSRELQKWSVEAERAARMQLLAALSKLVVNPENEIVGLMNGLGLVPILRSRQEQLAAGLKTQAQYQRGDGDPFDAFDDLQEAWQQFVSEFLSVEQARQNEAVS